MLLTGSRRDHRGGNRGACRSTRRGGWIGVGGGEAEGLANNVEGVRVFRGLPDLPCKGKVMLLLHTLDSFLVEAGVLLPLLDDAHGTKQEKVVRGYQQGGERPVRVLECEHEGGGGVWLVLIRLLDPAGKLGNLQRAILWVLREESLVTCLGSVGSVGVHDSSGHPVDENPGPLHIRMRLTGRGGGGDAGLHRGGNEGGCSSKLLGGDIWAGSDHQAALHSPLCSRHANASMHVRGRQDVVADRDIACGQGIKRGFEGLSGVNRIAGQRDNKARPCHRQRWGVGPGTPFGNRGRRGNHIGIYQVSSISKITSTRTTRVTRITSTRHPSFGLRFSRAFSYSIF